ncbi:hypothetical protein [Streptomyces sp. NPDC088812]|uniref:hypothetical protein n=1 Tax=Streptomyces sp. NPDC088812 TaxID=3365905 RepID=UPI00382A86D9
MAGMLAEHRTLTDPDRWAGLTLAELLPRLIAGFAALLERQGRVLGAFQQRGAVDPEVAKVGKAAYFDLLERFADLLLARRDEMRHSDPVRAVRSCFTVVYAALARGLALDVPAAAAEGTDLDTLLEDLGVMALAFLCADGEAEPLSD